MVKMLFADLEYLARTVYGEARGEGFAGKVAVACVMLNRAANGHRGERRPAGVVTEPWQFSCWNAADPNLARLLDVDLSDRHFRACVSAVVTACDAIDEGADPTRGAMHYHAHSVSPSWAAGKTPSAVIGGHRFYADID